MFSFFELKIQQEMLTSPQLFFHFCIICTQKGIQTSIQMVVW